MFAEVHNKKRHNNQRMDFYTNRCSKLYIINKLCVTIEGVEGTLSTTSSVFCC